MQQQIAVILGSAESGPFESLIGQLMSAANEQRSHAESLFNLCRDLHPDALALKLAAVLHASAALDFRAMSAVLLRMLLTHCYSDAPFWPRLSPASQTSLKSLLLAVLRQEPDRSTAKKVADTISALAVSLLPDSTWPDLLPFLFHAVPAFDAPPRLQESALLIFAQIAYVLADDASFVGSHLFATLHTLLLAALSHPSSPDVCVAALSAAVNLVTSLESDSDRDRLADLLPLMMRTPVEFLNSDNEATAQEALKLLVELAGAEPRFLRLQIVDVEALMQIAETDGLEEGTQHLAIEFIIILAEARERASEMMQKLPQFLSRLFAVLMKMLLDLEDDPAWHTTQVPDKDTGEISNYGVYRLAIVVGGNTIVPVASELLPAFLAAPEWKKRHAALIYFAQIAKGCSKMMPTNLEQVVTMVLSSFQDPHPRVRWAAINAVEELSIHLGPDLQTHYHYRVLPALFSAMEDFQNPRVQAHAASAVLYFCENCTAGVLMPYVDEIVSKFEVLLEDGKRMVEEGAITTFNSAAVAHYFCRVFRILVSAVQFMKLLGYKNESAKLSFLG